MNNKNNTENNVENNNENNTENNTENNAENNTENNTKNNNEEKLKKKSKQNNKYNDSNKILNTNLNNTEKITLQYMTNPIYNNIVLKDNNKNNLSEIKIYEKRNEIIFFKKNIINITKKLLDAFEKDEKVKIYDNVYHSFNNYLYNLISYIEHKKTNKSVKDELDEFDKNKPEHINIENNFMENPNESYINNIIQSKNNENNKLNKFIKITNLSKKEKIIPHKKNIYK